MLTLHVIHAKLQLCGLGAQSEKASCDVPAISIFGNHDISKSNFPFAQLANLLPSQLSAGDLKARCRHSSPL